MTENDKELFEGIATALVALAEKVPPKEFQAALAGIVATVVGVMSEDRWQKFVKIEPCGVPGCDCHLNVQPHGIELFKLLRGDYRSYGPNQESHAE